MSNVSFSTNPNIAPSAICDLREAVGWARQEEDYPAALQGYWATVGGFDAANTLVAWVVVKKRMMPSFPSRETLSFL